VDIVGNGLRQRSSGRPINLGPGYFSVFFSQSTSGFLVPEELRVGFPMVHSVRRIFDRDQFASSTHRFHFCAQLWGLLIRDVFVLGAVYQEKRRHVAFNVSCWRGLDQNGNRFSIDGANPEKLKDLQRNWLPRDTSRNKIVNSI